VVAVDPCVAAEQRAAVPTADLNKQLVVTCPAGRSVSEGGADLNDWRSHYGSDGGTAAAASGGTIRGDDLGVWQSNYGAGGAAARLPHGGGIDVLIGNTGGDRLLDMAVLQLSALASLPPVSAGHARLTVATDRGIENSAPQGTTNNQGKLIVGIDDVKLQTKSSSSAAAPQGKLYVATNAGVFASATTTPTFEAQGRLLIGTDGGIW
jgi:hypothetical protein